MAGDFTPIGCLFSRQPLERRFARFECVEPVLQSGDFPVDLLPAETGLILADAFDAEVVRMGPETPLSGARRKVVLRTFARTAASRLQGFRDPGTAAWVTDIQPPR